MLVRFASVSGLKINFDKNKCSVYSKIIFLPHLEIKWNPATFKVLGVHFSINTEITPSINYEGKLLKIQKLLNAWSKLHLIPLGKTAVIKSLVVSYLTINIPDPTQGFIQELETILLDFLWNTVTVTCQDTRLFMLLYSKITCSLPRLEHTETGRHTHKLSLSLSVSLCVCVCVSLSLSLHPSLSPPPPLSPPPSLSPPSPSLSSPFSISHLSLSLLPLLYLPPPPLLPLLYLPPLPLSPPPSLSPPSPSLSSPFSISPLSLSLLPLLYLPPLPLSPPPSLSPPSPSLSSPFSISPLPLSLLPLLYLTPPPLSPPLSLSHPSPSLSSPFSISPLLSLSLGM